METVYSVIMEHWCTTCNVPIKVQVQVPDHGRIPVVQVEHYSPVIHRVISQIY